MTLVDAREWIAAAHREAAHAIELCDDLTATTDVAQAMALANELISTGSQLVRDAEMVRLRVDNPHGENEVSA